MSTEDLVRAAYEGHEDTVMRLCTTHNVNVNGFADVPLPEGMYAFTPLMAAALRGYSKCVALLLQAGATVQMAHPKTRRTAVHEAASCPSRATLQQMAVTSKGTAWLRTESVGRQRPIHIAAESGSVDVVEYLLAELGPSEGGVACKGGWTAAHFAGNAGHSAVLRALSAYGVSLCIPDKYGRIAAHNAAREGHVESLVVLGAEALLAGDSTAKTPLHAAAFEGHLAVLQHAVTTLDADSTTTAASHAALSTPDATGQNVAHYAAKRHPEGSDIITFLREHALGRLSGAKRKAEEGGGKSIFDVPDVDGMTAAALLSGERCTEAGGAFRVSNLAAKRWQRSVFISGTATAVGQCNHQHPSAVRCLVLDDGAAGSAQPYHPHPLSSICLSTSDTKRMNPDAGDASVDTKPAEHHVVGDVRTQDAGVEDIAYQTFDAERGGSARTASTCASVSGDLLASGVVSEAGHITVANPDVKVGEVLKRMHPGLDVVSATSTEVLEGLGGALLSGVWLDYCNGIASDTNRADVGLVFGGTVLADRSCVCFTYSWRGAKVCRTGRPKQGTAHLAHFAADLEATLMAEAAANGRTLTRLEPPTQCGQLFFLSFLCERRKG